MIKTYAFYMAQASEFQWPKNNVLSRCRFFHTAERFVRWRMVSVCTETFLFVALVSFFKYSWYQYFMRTFMKCSKIRWNRINIRKWNRFFNQSNSGKFQDAFSFLEHHKSHAWKQRMNSVLVVSQMHRFVDVSRATFIPLSAHSNRF